MSSSERPPGRGIRSLIGILRYLRAYPRTTILCVLMLLVNIGIEMTLPQLIGASMTGLQQREAGVTGFDLRPYVAALVILVLVRAVVGHRLGTRRNGLVQRVLNDIRADIYDSLQRQAFQFHDRTNSGELISRSTTDVSRLQDFLFACLFLLVDILAALVITVVLIWLVNPWLGALTLATMLPTAGLIIFYAARLQPQWRKVHDLHGAMTTVIQENIAGVRVVKAFAREREQVDKFRTQKDAFLAKVTETVNYWAARVPFAQFIFGLATPLVLGIGGLLVIRGHLPVGDLTKVILYLMAIGHRLGLVGQFTNIVQNASASAERILEIVDEPRAVIDGPRSLPPDGTGRVEFRSVSFRHRGRASGTPDSSTTAPPPEPTPAALHEVSFTVAPGQTVAVVGPTGAGKSTLVSLIPRFHDPDSGSVLLDGVDVRDLRLAELRRSVGFIFQETFLFSATVRDNIAYGRPEATLDEVVEAARAAQAHEFIEALDKGYDTVIGERGVSLSGGQRQRLAIARAFLMNPRWLILDDATASVDPATERLIQEAMRRLSAGRTTFVIAQRVSTVRHADLILVLRQGRLVQSGRHEELLQAGGDYRQVFDSQIHP